MGTQRVLLQEVLVSLVPAEEQAEQVMWVVSSVTTLLLLESIHMPQEMRYQLEV